MKIVPQKVEYVDHMGSDLSVVNAARVSFNKVSNIFSEGDTRLIKYLASHNHWTPFGHTSISLRIKCPIFIARQLGKHQVGLVWNEVSRRYVDEEPEFFFPDEWRGRPVNAKQGSSGRCEGMYVNEDKDWFNDDLTMPLTEQVHLLNYNALLTYNEMIAAGCAPEQARMILPQNMMTEFIWTGSLIASTRIYNLRSDLHAQLEVQEVAKMIGSIIEPLYPVSWKALTT